MNRRHVIFIMLGLLFLGGLLIGGAVTAAFAYRSLASTDAVQQAVADLTTALQDEGEAAGQQEATTFQPDPDQPLSEQGVLVMAVDTDGPAAAAGLRRGSIILAVNGEAVNTPAELHEAIQAHEAGDTISLTVLNGDEPVEIAVTLESAGPYLGVEAGGGCFCPGAEVLPAQPFGIVPGQPGPFGFGGSDGEFQIEMRAVVAEVVEESPAAETGLQPGDVITAIDGEAIDSGQELVERIGELAPDDSVELTVEREGETLTLPVTLGEHPDEAGRAYLGVRLGPVARFFEQFPAPETGPSFEEQRS